MQTTAAAYPAQPAYAGQTVLVPDPKHEHHVDETRKPSYGLTKALAGLCHLLKLGIAIAIIVIVAVHLNDITVDRGLTRYRSSCLMGDSNGADLCIYAYVVCGISLIATILLSIFLCVTCDLCGLGFIFEFILALFGTLWWLAAAIVFTTEGTRATDASVPQHGWRLAVWILCWIQFVIFAFITLLYLVRGLSKICSCCTRRERHDGMNTAKV